MSSIFISHRNVPHDNVWAERIHTWIKDQKDIDGFLDFDIQHGLQAGGRWEDEIYAAMNRAQVVIALVSPDWLDSKWCTSEAHMAKLQGLKFIPIVITECNHPFGDIQTIRISKGEERAFEQLRHALRTTHKLPKRPYPGLAAFQEDDAAVFFGRDDETRDLVNQVDSLFQGRPETPRLLLVLGASGSGKSSLLRAGLIPEIKSHVGQIAIEPIIPRGAPLSEMEHVLGISLSGLPPVDAADAILAALKVIDPNYKRALISIDQAEELLRSDQRFFFEVLKAVLDRANGRVAVLATMRSDFLNEFQQSSLIGKGSNLEYETFTLDPLPEDRLTDIIAKPAGRFETAFEDGLITQMAQDHGGPDALPLLAFFLNEFWRDEYIIDGILQLAEYESFGGLNQALQKAVDRAIAECARLDPAYSDRERLLRDLQEVFLGAMVSVSSISGEAVRNRVAADALTEQHTALLTAFAKQRLLIQKDGNWEVVHEALFRQWAALRDWIKEAREDLIVVDRIQTASIQWHEAGHQESDLTHTGNRLDEATRMLRSTRYAKRFSDIDANYLEACAKRYRDQLAKEADLRKQAEQGRARAEEQSAKAEAARLVASEQSVRAQKGEARARRFTGLVAIVAVIAISAGAFAYWQTTLAQKQTAVAQEQSAVAQAKTALNLLPKRPIDGLIQAIEAADPNRVQFQTKRPMHPAIQTSLVAALQLASAGRMERDALIGHNSWVRTVAFHPQDQRLISSDDQGEMRDWSLTGEHAGKLFPVQDIGAAALTVSPDSAFIAALGYNELLLLDWSGKRVNASIPSATLDGDAEFLAVAIGPESQNIIASDDDGNIFHWNLLEPTAEPSVFPLSEESSLSLALAFAPSDGAQAERDRTGNMLFASGGEDGIVRLWSTDKLDGPLCLLRGHRDSVNTLKFTPDGKFLISGSDDRTLRRWSIGALNRTNTSTSLPCDQASIPFHGSQKKVLSVDISPDGELIASAGEGARIRFWNIYSTPVSPPLAGHEGPIYQVAFSPDGQTIASVSLDQTVRLWDRPPLAVADSGAITGISLSSDGLTIASAGENMGVQLWDADLNRLKGNKAFKDNNRWSGRVGFVNGGEAVASIWQEWESRILHLTDRQGHKTKELHYPQLSNDEESAFAISKDGKYIATSDGKGRLIYRSSTGKTVFGPYPDNSSDAEKLGDLELVDISAAGDLIATFWTNGEVRILSHDGKIHPGFEQPVFRAYEYGFNDIRFNESGQYMISVGQDPEVLVHDLESNERSFKVGTHDDVVTAAQFFLDDQFVVSVSEDDSLRIWRRDGSMVGVPMTGHTGWMNWLQIDDAKKLAFTGADDGTIRRWDLSFVDAQPADLLDEACRLLQAHSIVPEKSDAARKVCEDAAK